MTEYSLDEDRIVHWLKTGAQPSDALHSLMKRSGLAHRWHLIQQGLDEKDIEKEMKKWAADREETLKRRAEKAEDKAKKAKLKKAEEKAPELSLQLSSIWLFLLYLQLFLLFFLEFLHDLRPIFSFLFQYLFHRALAELSAICELDRFSSLSYEVHPKVELRS